MLNVLKVERQTSAITDALQQWPVTTEGSWLWVYNSVPTIRQGSKPGEVDADAQVLKVKLSLNWTGPLKTLAVGPEKVAPDIYGHSPTSSSTRTCLQTCPVRTPKLACRSLAASRVRTRATKTTCLFFASWSYPVCAQQLKQQIATLPRDQG